MKGKARIMIGLGLALILAAMTIAPGLAQSTTKSLSTNFTLVNLGDGPAQGVIQYIKTDGTPWGSGSETFTISSKGGQAIFRQYDLAGRPGNPNLTDGAGSVVISADQPLGAVVQILARNQNPTSSGAYSGFTGGSTSYYVPLVARKLSTATGIGNSQIIVQNAGNNAVNVEIELIKSDGSTTYTKSGISIQPGASYYYDLAQESPNNVPDGWYGSAVVRTTTTGGAIAVVSNFFTGDAMQTFNAFSSASPTTRWFVPLFTSRLANGLSTPVAVQNLSGNTIPIGGVSLRCTPDPSLSGYTPFTKTNTTAIGNTAAYYFNPVVDTSIPQGFYGSCVVEASANIVAFVQMRFVTTGEAAAYEAFPAGSTDTKVFIPLVAQRLANGFATAVTIQNLSNETATFNLTYTRSPDCTVGPETYSPSPQTVGPYASLIQNHRTGVSGLVDGWFGTLTVHSDKPIAAFVQLTFLRNINPNLPGGDNYMAHNAFTQP
ncbi:MAG: hypothetical protein QXT77_03935 [Candidatus Methanomethylicaceae archaeon]